MKLWTIQSDYSATGEGRTIQALITYAKDEAEAIKKFGDEFDPYFALGAEAKEGIIESEITKYLFNATMFDNILKMEGKANIRLAAELHFNFS